MIGFFWSTVLLWHTTFLVNSAAHVFGRRRYDTTDTSRNSLIIALLTGGEGWHNNHHHYQASARQGFFWWEIDFTYYGLKVMSWFGIVKDLKAPPARILHPAPSPKKSSSPPSALSPVVRDVSRWRVLRALVARSSSGRVSR